jgi:RND family efflux transporter MFP subunit
VIDERTMQVSQMQQAVTTRVNNLAAEAARIAQQEAILDRLRIGVQRAERDLANARLTAPFSGFVREVSGEMGKRVSPNDRVARLTDAETLEVRFLLSDAQFGRIIAADGDLGGRPVRIVWQVGGRALIFDGKIDRVGARIAAASGGVEVFARIADTNALTPIRPGAFVEVYMPDRGYPAVARLPEAALFERNKVYVVEDGRLVPRPVTVAAFDGDDVLVAGELADGDQVLTTRFARAGAGVRVKTEATP